MFSKVFKILFLLLLLAAASFSIHAQFSNPNEPRKEDLPQGIKENLAKQRIEQEKKDYEELIKRGEEAMKLSEELEKAFAANNTLSSDDRKKLDRLEKLVKRIRSDLGGDDDEETSVSDEDTPLSMANAFQVLKENTVKLVEQLKKSTRYTISAVAIKSTNLLLKVVRFMRFGK